MGLVAAVVLVFAVACDAAAQTTKKKPAAVPAKKAAPKPPVKKAVPKKPAPKAPAKKKAAPSAPPAPVIPISTFCVDADTGIVISEMNADIPRPPASMIKLMLMLMVVEGVHAKKWRWDTPVTVTAHAQGMGGTQVLIAAGETWPLEHMMRAVATASANDAAMAVAETLWGSEAAYLKAANARAAELGMTKTIINGVHGLPPGKGEAFDQTTARDMAQLARACVQYPKILEWTAAKSFKLREGAAEHDATNKLLTQMPDCDGLKTGFIRAAGFCIAATAKREDIRLISIAMGYTDKVKRFNDAQQLLEDGFKSFRKVRLVRANDSIDRAVPAVDCTVKQIKLVTADELWVKMRVADLHRVKYSAVLPEVIEPPVIPGNALGKLVLRLDGAQIGEVALLPPANLSLCGWVVDPKAGEEGGWGPPRKRGFFRRN